MDGNFRKLNVDQYDPSKHLSIQDLLPELPPVSDADIKARATEVRSLLSSGDYSRALAVSLSDPPYGGSEDIKNVNLQTVLDVLATIRSNNITPTVQSLSTEQRDILIKYIYKGMGSPVGQANGNGGILLTWFEKTVDITGQGAIIRYMSDRRTV
ncbi:hypothetical protein DV451_001682 [Geotrichum candidum]|uniref:Actin-related protein 2/3 complex subunit 5 n=1 Tax=Geotrichum candidum TaxID=1173061 RepID=A0A0J9XKV8_GEOCN|nr:hypothetical protein DV451_001682 [Geotrichum candidum]KAF5110121.1 hypothetical protein DV453_001103 [Geotrichum candidum]KAF5117475.1 hypothetical protein DV452_002329 [Geotrichum candidum]KAF5118589.1 hypothetical protein DV454_000416 [Geotrichum candidum]KAF5124869.1 hypothetical protein DV495_003694 [Geotrichum candidum]